MKNITETGFLIILFLLTTVLSSTVHAQINQNVSPQLYNDVTPVESTIARTAIIALRHIAQARSDIYRKEMASARINLDQAERLMETISEDLSTARVKNLLAIARKHLEYENALQVLRDDLPPIISNLEMISIYLPIDKAKLHIDRSKEFLKKNDKWGAGKELAQADKSLIVIEVELPLLKMRHYVAKARKHLAEGDSVKADEALKVAEQRAMSLYTGVNSPLLQANRSLWLTFQNYSTTSRAVVRAHLEQAKKNLSKMATGGGTKGKEEANKLSLEIAELGKKLAGDGKVAESELKAVWEKSKALAERSTAYLSAGLSEAESTLGRDNNLIEAKLHVTYAEIYHLTTAEPEKAIKELDTAYSYLQKAAEDALTGPEDRKRIHNISNVIKVLKTDSKMRDITVQERYDEVKEELSDLKNKEELVDLSQKIRDK